MQQLPTVEGPSPLPSYTLDVCYKQERAETPGGAMAGRELAGVN